MEAIWTPYPHIAPPIVKALPFQRSLQPGINIDCGLFGDSVCLGWLEGGREIFCLESLNANDLRTGMTLSFPLDATAARPLVLGMTIVGVISLSAQLQLSLVCGESFSDRCRSRRPRFPRK